MANSSMFCLEFQKLVCLLLFQVNIQKRVFNAELVIQELMCVRNIVSQIFQVVWKPVLKKSMEQNEN